MKRGVIFAIVLGIVVIVLGALVLIGVFEGDETTVDKNGVDGAPAVVVTSPVRG